MKKKILSISSILLLAVCLTTMLSCSDNKKKEDQTHYYTIGISSMSVSGSSDSYLTALMEAEGKFDEHFTLTGSKMTCDAQAKVKFADAMVILQNSANTVTDCTGHVDYVLDDINGNVLASHSITFKQ